MGVRAYDCFFVRFSVLFWVLMALQVEGLLNASTFLSIVFALDLLSLSVLKCRWGGLTG